MNRSGATSAQQTYQQRAETFDRGRLQLKNQADWVSWGRVILFLAAAGCFYLGWSSGDWSMGTWRAGGPARLWIVAAGLLSILFLTLVSWSGRLRKQEDRLMGLVTLNRHARARLERQWDQFPVPVIDLPTEAKTISRDLDLFGHASLFQLACTAHTSLGRRRLRDWFIQPADPETLSQRQAAVLGLAPELELRQEFELLSQRAAKGCADVNKFVEWAEGEPWLAKHPGLVVLARALPIGTLVLLALGVFQVVPMALWVLPVILGLAMSFVYCRKVHAIFQRISSSRDEIRLYSDLFRQAMRLPTPCFELQRLLKRLSGGRAAPHLRLARLGRIMDLANFRYSPMVFMVVQPLFMLDFHVLWLAESWQRRSGGCVRD